MSGPYEGALPRALAGGEGIGFVVRESQGLALSPHRAPDEHHTEITVNSGSGLPQVREVRHRLRLLVLAIAVAVGSHLASLDTHIAPW